MNKLPSTDKRGVVFREPTQVFSLPQLLNFFFKAPKGKKSPLNRARSLITTIYFFLVSSLVQRIRNTGFMDTANMLGSLLSDLPSVYKLHVLRKDKTCLINKTPTNAHQIIILYLPSKEGEWKDYYVLHKALEKAVGHDKIAAQHIKSWKDGGDMKEVHIRQVRSKITQLNKQFPDNSIVVVGWSHGAETLPWALVDPATYEVDKGTIYSMTGRSPELLHRDLLKIDHLFRLCSPMTKQEANLTDLLVTEVCSRHDCILPSKPYVPLENQVWIDEGHVGVLFSSTVVDVVKQKVLDLLCDKT